MAHTSPPTLYKHPAIASATDLAYPLQALLLFLLRVGTTAHRLLEMAPHCTTGIAWLHSAHQLAEGIHMAHRATRVNCRSMYLVERMYLVDAHRARTWKTSSRTTVTAPRKGFRRTTLRYISPRCRHGCEVSPVCLVGVNRARCYGSEHAFWKASPARVREKKESLAAYFCTGVCVVFIPTHCMVASLFHLVILHLRVTGSAVARPPCVVRREFLQRLLML